MTAKWLNNCDNEKNRNAVFCGWIINLVNELEMSNV